MLKELSLNYMVLRYVPSILRKENIITGIVIHVPEKEYSIFFPSTAYKRIKNFDDEMDKNLFNADMASMSEIFNYPTNKNNSLNLGYFNFNDINNRNFLETRKKLFSNQYRFDNVETIKCRGEDELLEDINNLKEIYLHYDKPKNKRKDARQLKSTLNKIIKNKNKEVNKNINKFKNDIDNENIFDYSIKSKFYIILSFDYKKKKSLSKEIKNKLYDIYDFLEKNKDVNNEIIFLINNSVSDDDTLFKNFLTKINDLSSKHKITIKVMKISEFASKI